MTAIHPVEPGAEPASATDAVTRAVTRGAGRALAELGYSVLFEMTLASGRRVDVIGLNKAGEVLIVEVKSSLADFRADGKWHDYRPFCDRFFFAVPEGFPREVLPGDCGLMVADAYGAAVLREAPLHRLPGARRRAIVGRFARKAADRLHALIDPRL